MWVCAFCVRYIREGELTGVALTVVEDVSKVEALPWEGIRRDYIQGISVDGKHVYPKLKDLAGLYKVSYAAITMRACRGKWLVHRESLQREIEGTRRQKFVETLAARGVDLDIRTYETAIQAVECIRNALGAAPLSPEDLRNLGIALRDLQATGRLAVGMKEGSGLSVEILQQDQLSDEQLKERIKRRLSMLRITGPAYPPSPLPFRRDAVVRDAPRQHSGCL
jgi:hypothetical protein